MSSENLNGLRLRLVAPNALLQKSSNQTRFSVVQHSHYLGENNMVHFGAVQAHVMSSLQHIFFRVAIATLTSCLSPSQNVLGRTYAGESCAFSNPRHVRTFFCSTAESCLHNGV